MINIGLIKNISRVKKCTKGTVITGDGLVNIMFLILKGEVGVYTNYRFSDAEMVQALGAGDFFADSGLLQDKKAAYTTVALSEAIILPVDKRTFHVFLQDEPALAFELIKDLYLRLQEPGSAPSHPAENQEQQEQTPKEIKPEVKKNSDKKQAQKPGNKPTASNVSATVPSGLAGEGAEKNGMSLFLDGHGTYELQLNNDDTTRLMNKNHTCPICRGSFSCLAVKPSKLILASTDKDMRNRYKGIEPLYYEVLTCPHCLYSALPDVFETPDKSKQDILRELEPLKNSVKIKLGQEKDTDSVFTGFYLALFCAPISFSKYQLVAGKLFYKLSRVYQDAGDQNMEILTAKKALDNYLYTYEKIGISPSQEQQICILIGELYLKQGSFKNAISFFSKAKSSGNTNPALKNHVENRIYDIREMVAANR